MLNSSELLSPSVESRTLLDLSLGLTDRGFLVGQTGTGKTTLAQLLLGARNHPYIVVFDTKGMMRKEDWPGYEIHKRLDAAIRSKQPKLIWQPEPAELRSWETIDRGFRWIYERWNTLLYVDEALDVTLRQEIPFGFHAVLTRGRQRIISTLVATQRPTGIPQSIISEAQHRYIFYLQLEQDRKRMESLTGIAEERIKKLDKYEFFYSRQGEREASGILKLTIKGRESDNGS